MTPLTIHLIANAHLDPVWLWDWREGLNEGITTCRTILEMMDADPDLTFVRGEAAIYRHIEENDPDTFHRIRQRVVEGRWDVVGGNWIQPDTNLPATEMLLRQFELGRAYFSDKLGVKVRAAWAADSFGHSAGLPEILAATGIDSIALCRPAQEQLPLAKPAFWWEGPGGSRVLAYRPITPYLTERHEIPAALERTINEAKLHGLRNAAFFYGVGNHGGGPTRRQIADIFRLAGAHPEIRVIHSGLHPFFAALRRELRRQPPDHLPLHRGELNFCLRGCYASVAKFKFAYRAMESGLLVAERSDAAVRHALHEAPSEMRQDWETALFNAFHDILPGSSIERAYDDQLAQVGAVVSCSQRVLFDALNTLSAGVDTSVEPATGDNPTAVTVLVWNPHPREFHGPVEFEVPLDYRPIGAYSGRADQLPLQLAGPDRRKLPFQTVATENAAFPNSPWRKRLVTRLRIPPLGWSVVETAWVEGARIPPAKNPATAPGPGVIENHRFRVEARKGQSGLRIMHNGRPLLGGTGLQLQMFDDPWGSWGGMLEEPGSFRFRKALETWKINAVRTIESGPERASLWLRFQGARSWLALKVSLCREREAVDFSARLLWNERAARLKLVLPFSGDAEFEVPGGEVCRRPCGEVPGGRWVRVVGAGGKLGFASDALYSFDHTEKALRPTIVRATRYAATTKVPGEEAPWLPAVDCGELKFRFLLNAGGADLPQLAEELEQPPVVHPAVPSPGPLPRSGSFGCLLPPDSLRLLSLRKAGRKSLLLRIQSCAAHPVQGTFVWQGRRMDLGKFPPRQIQTLRVQTG